MLSAIMAVIPPDKMCARGAQRVDWDSHRLMCVEKKTLPPYRPRLWGHSEALHGHTMPFTCRAECLRAPLMRMALKIARMLEIRLTNEQVLPWSGHIHNDLQFGITNPLWGESLSPTNKTWNLPNKYGYLRPGDVVEDAASSIYQHSLQHSETAKAL
jgi:hypothetical protein